MMGFCFSPWTAALSLDSNSQAYLCPFALTRLARSEARGERTPPALGFFCISPITLLLGGLSVACGKAMGIDHGRGHGQERGWRASTLGTRLAPCLIAYYSADCDWPELGPGYPKESPSSGPNPSLIKRATALHS